MRIKIEFMSANTLEATRYLYVGIFADEKNLQFLELLQTMADQCLHELHSVVSKKVGIAESALHLPSECSGSSAYSLAFQTGLKTLRNWGHDVLQQEVDRLKTKCSAVDQLYKNLVIRYLRELYKNEKPQTIDLTVPSLREFIRLFYFQLSNNPLVRHLKYFSTFGLEKKAMMMECVRNALFQLLESQIDFQTTVQLESGVPSAFPSKATTSHILPPKPPLRPWTTDASSSFDPPSPPPPPPIRSQPEPRKPVLPLPPLPSPVPSAIPSAKKSSAPPPPPSRPPSAVPSLSEMVKTLRAESKRPTHVPAPTASRAKSVAPPPPAPKVKPAPTSAKKDSEVRVIEIDVDLPQRGDEDKPPVASSPPSSSPNSPKLFEPSVASSKSARRYDDDLPSP